MSKKKPKENKLLVIADERIANYLSRPYSRIIIQDEDGSFRAEIIEFPGCIAVGSTPLEALGSLDDVAFNWLEAALDANQPIPEPIESSSGFSGRLALRLPRSLHRKATWVAERESISLNQFIVYSLAEAVGERKSQQVTFIDVNLIPVHPFNQGNLPFIIYNNGQISNPVQMSQEFTQLSTLNA